MPPNNPNVFTKVSGYTGIEAFNIDHVGDEEQRDQSTRTRYVYIRPSVLKYILAGLAALVISIAIFASGKGGASSSSPQQLPSALVVHCSNSAKDEGAEEIIDQIVLTVTDKTALEDKTSPQYRAMNWIICGDEYVIDQKNNNTNAVILERYILAVFYYSTGGDSWNYCNQGADCNFGESYLSPTSICGWVGNTCDNDNIDFLDTLRLNGQTNDIGLNGSIPSELFHLDRIKQIFLRNHPDISGNIPTSIRSAENLGHIFLEKNALTGTIPADLGDVTSLRYLAVSENKLSGSIPATLGNLPILKWLLLDNNKLSGSIPSSLGSLGNLQILSLPDNKLSGSVPSELGSLTNLVLLNLGNNKLSGSLPATLENLASLGGLMLGNNTLNGAIPASFGNLSNLKSLFLNDNEFSKPIPSELGSLSNLQNLWLNDNKLSGSVPSELGSLSFTNLKTFYLYNNKLSGSIPTELGRLKTAREMRLNGNNDLTGTVPSQICALRQSKLMLLMVSCSIHCNCCTPNPECLGL